jgi:lipopolysaccharide/colanic/teichoic acid biosynthesis glycosyltransferase
MLVAAIAIKLDSPGPVFHRAIRVGRDGRTFTFLKLRSMRVGAEELRGLLLHLNQAQGPAFKLQNDPRVTRVGRWLRKLSLDELPQLFHVLTGEMSLVGPRPPFPEEVERYEPWMLRRLSVTPGLTCLWQIRGRSDLGFDEWMRLDLEYVDRLSFLLDLKILALTLPAVISARGAY